MENKINILFLTVQLETIGGSERLIYDLVSSLDRNVFRPSVAWLQGEKILDEFLSLDVPFYFIPKIRRRDPSTFRKIAKIINEKNIHVVNAHHFMPMFYAYYGCKLANKIKLFYTEHSQWEIARITGKWKFIGKYLLNKIDGTIGISKSVSLEIKRKFNVSEKNIFTIINGVNINSIINKNEYNIRKRISMGFSESDLLVGIVANLKNNKNHLFLLKAFNELLKEINEVKLLIIGEGDIRDPENSEPELRRYVNERKISNKVFFMGYRSDIHEILNTFNVFCLTSEKEGLPISIIEAMAAGLPVVGTDVEGIRDVIRSNETGFLVRLGDVSGLNNALMTLLKDESLRYKMGMKAQIMAKKLYSLNHCVEQYQKLFGP